MPDMSNLFDYWSAPNRRTGRTTRMLEAAVDSIHLAAKYSKKDVMVFVIGHNQRYANELVERLHEMCVVYPNLVSDSRQRGYVKYAIDGLRFEIQGISADFSDKVQVEKHLIGKSFNNYNIGLFIDHFVFEHRSRFHYDNFSYFMSLLRSYNNVNIYDIISYKNIIPKEPETPERYIDQFRYHEIMDRCHVINSNIDDHLINHYAVDEEMIKKLEEAQEKISAVYMLADKESEMLRRRRR